MVFKFSKWADPILVNTAISQDAISAILCISPGMEIPNSITLISLFSLAMEKSVIGSPSWELAFPLVSKTDFSIERAFAIMALVVVFPTDPVTPMTKPEYRLLA